MPPESAHFTTTDGVRLRFFDSRGPGPALLLANGLGGPWVAFAPLWERLRSTFRLLSWDYRGLYGSADPATEIVDFSVRRNALDALELLDHLAVPRASFLGWSMGVQIGLEAALLAPTRLQALVLLNGTSGRPLATLPLPGAPLLPSAFPFVGRLDPALRALLRAAERADVAPLRLGKRLGFVGPGFTEPHYRAMLTEFASIDFRLYFRMLDELCRHDATPRLEEITAPALVLSGERDRVTPRVAAERLCRGLRLAEHRTLRNATHYAAAEVPAEVARAVVDFRRNLPF